MTLTGPAPPGSVEVSGGKVRLRIENQIGTVISELCDPAAAARQQAIGDRPSPARRRA